MRQHEGKHAFTKPSERIEARLAYIRTALKITDAQQAQWNAFAETLRNQARSADQRMQEFRAQREPGRAREAERNYAFGARATAACRIGDPHQ